MQSSRSPSNRVAATATTNFGSSGARVTSSTRSYTTGRIVRSDHLPEPRWPENRVGGLGSVKFQGAVVCLLLALLTGGCVPAEVNEVGGGSQARQASPFLRLYSTLDDSTFGCQAVATKVGVLTAKHCVDGGASLVISEATSGEWPASFSSSWQHVTVLSSALPTPRLELASVRDGEEVRALTRRGWVSAIAHVYPKWPADPSTVSADFPAAQGDSGGAVLNGDGRLIGLIVGASHFGATLIEPIPASLLAVAGSGDQHEYRPVTARVRRFKAER